MRVDRRYQSDILTDSTASLVTEGLLGNRYVNITRGFTGTPLGDAGVIPGAEEKAMKEVVERSAELLGNLTALSSDVQDLINGVQQGKGSLGRLLTDEQAYNHLKNLLAKGDMMMTNVQEGRRTLGKLATSDEKYTKVEQGLHSQNVVLPHVPPGKGTIGKPKYEPNPHQQAKGAHQKG